MREGWRCEECGEPGDHLVEQCPDSEANGNNPRDPFGVRDQCNQCSSFNHLSAECRHSKKNGSNQEGHEGKFQCGLCGSYDHLTQSCQRIHSKKLGKNRTGIGGKKLSCDICNSFNHQREDHNKVTDCCHHCGRFDHATDRCPEITIRTVKFVPGDTEDFQWRPLPIEEQEGGCSWCSDPHHSSKTCHRKHDQDIGNKPYPCPICGSFSHEEQECFHSEVNGKNPTVQGKKVRCGHCKSYNHTTEVCSDRHGGRNGRNPEGADGIKKRCGYCGSFDHLEKCPHSREFGGNMPGLRCDFCGSFDHLLDEDCLRQNHMVRDFLRSKIGYEKKTTRKPISAAVSSEEEKVLQKEAEGKILARLKRKAEGKGSPIKRSNFSEAASTSKEPVNPKGEEEPTQTIFDIFKDEDLRTDKTKQPEISRKMHEEITEALKGDKLVVKSFKINIKTSDLLGLNGENWLNDNVIEFYMNLIADRSMKEAYRREKLPTVYAMSTYFFRRLMENGPSAVKRWLKNVDIFDYDLILVPIHQEEHWCLATVDFRCPGVFYYDSMGGHNMPALSLILEYLQVEHLNKRNAVLDIKRYVKEIVEDCPQQENGADCGIFACKAAEFLSRDETLKFSQQDMQFYRKLMVYEISKKRLLIDQP